MLIIQSNHRINVAGVKGFDPRVVNRMNCRYLGYRIRSGRLDTTSHKHNEDTEQVWCFSERLHGIHCPRLSR